MRKTLLFLALAALQTAVGCGQEHIKHEGPYPPRAYPNEIAEPIKYDTLFTLSTWICDEDMTTDRILIQVLTQDMQPTGFDALIAIEMNQGCQEYFIELRNKWGTGTFYLLIEPYDPQLPNHQSQAIITINAI